MNPYDPLCYVQSGPQGWICPKCGRVWSPSWPGPCVCSNEKTETTTSTGTWNAPKANIERTNNP